jgi:hypothetical protein
MCNRVLITSLASLIWMGTLAAQTGKSSLAKTTALTKAFQPNASKAENLETLRRTLGLSQYAKLEWIAGTNGVDTLSASDDFNRAELGPDWAVDDKQWEIRDGELSLRSTANYEWQYLAVYTPISNTSGRRLYSASYRWGKNVDALGIREGAHAIMVDGPEPGASGYWIWHRTN